MVEVVDKPQNKADNNKQKLKTLESAIEIVGKINESYNSLKKKADDFNKNNKQTQQITQQMIQPLGLIIEAVKEIMSKIDNGDIKKEEGNVEHLNLMISSLTSSLSSVNDLVQISLNKNRITDLRPFVDQINILIDSINDINLTRVSSKKIEGIQNRIGYIKNIIDGINGIEPKNSVDQINLIKNGIEALEQLLLDVSQSNVSLIGDDFVQNITKNMNTIKSLLEYLSNELFNNNQIKGVIDNIQSLQNLIKNLVEFSNAGESFNLKNFINYKISLLYIKSLLSSLGSLLNYINKENFKFDSNFIKEEFLEATENLTDIIDNIKKINEGITIKTILSQIQTFTLTSWFLRTFVDEVKLIEKKVSKMDSIDIENALNNSKNIQSLVDSITKIKINPKTILLMTADFWQLRLMLSIYRKNIESAKNTTDSTLQLNISTLIQNNNSLIELLRSIEEINDVKLSPKVFAKRMNDLIEILTKLDDTIIKINNKSQNAKKIDAEPFLNILKVLKSIVREGQKIFNVADKSVKQLRNIILGLDVILTALIASVPLYAMFIIVSPVIISCIWIVSKVIRIISLSLAVIGPNTTRSFVQLIAIIGMMTLLVLGLVVLAEASKIFLKDYGKIILTLVAVTGILALIALIGFGMTFVLPFVTAMTIGMAAITISVLAILAVVGMLYLLQQIELDKDKIEENVKEIMDTIMMILKTLSTSPFDYGTQTDDKNKSLWAILGTSTVNMLSSLEGMVAIVAAAVSVAGILLITLMLKALEQLNLDEDKVMENVNKVLSIVGNINTMLISDPKKGKQSQLGFWNTVIEYVAKPLVPLWDAILTMAYLTASVVSVAGILLIAGMLRVLQTLNLDQNKILTNVRSVIETAQAISDSLNQPIMSTQQFDKGILGGLLSYVSPQIGSLWNSIITMAYLASIIINIAGILLITQMLKTLADVDPNIANQSKNSALNIMEASRSVMNAIYDSSLSIKEEETKSPWWEKALKWIGLSDFAEAITNLGKLAQLIIVIGAVSKLTKELNSIELKEGGIDRAVNATTAVLNASSKIVTRLINDQNNEIDKKKINNWSDNIERQRGLIKQIGKLAKEESKIASSITIEDVMNGSNISQSALTASDDIIKNITNLKGDPDDLKNKLSVIDAMNESLRGIVTVSDQDVKNTKDLTDTYIRFINRLDQADLQRLNVTERMMGHWAYIAKMIDGDFDKLVLMLSEKMMPMLDSMNKTMEGVSEVQQSIILQLTDPTLGTTQGTLPDVENMSMGNAGFTSQTPRLTGEDYTPGNSWNEPTQQNTNEKIPTVVPESSVGQNNPSSERGFVTKGLSGARRGTEDEPVYAIIVGTK